MEKQVRRGFTSRDHRDCVDVGLKMRQEPSRREPCRTRAIGLFEATQRFSLSAARSSGCRPSV